MNAREVTTQLRDAGFTLVKAGSKHDLWAKGAVTMPVSRGTRGSHANPRAVKSLRAAIRRAERLTEPRAPGRYI